MANEINDLRLAVLIDADNVPCNSLKAIMEEAAIYGTPTIKRIYGDWTSPNIGGWKTELWKMRLHRFSNTAILRGKFHGLSHDNRRYGYIVRRQG